VPLPQSSVTSAVHFGDHENDGGLGTEEDFLDGDAPFGSEWRGNPVEKARRLVTTRVIRRTIGATTVHLIPLLRTEGHA
jgi:hypothetical protein